MTTIAEVYPGSYGDTTLPRFDLSYTRPFPGALVDLAADHLPLGKLAVWRDLISNWPLPTGNSRTSPTVVDDGGKRVVRFNGTTDQMLASISTPQPLTLVLVGRTRDNKAGNVFKSGGIVIESDATNSAYRVSNSSGISGGVPSSAQHVFVASVNGASSVFSVDGIEYAGTMATSANTYIGFGTNSAGTVYTPSDISRFIILPYAANAEQRRAISAEMTAHYV